jgi:hypothetical protein
MQSLSDDDRMSTQLEGKKLKGFGARFGQIFGQIIESAIGLKSSMELDDERGIQAEEIIFNDKGQEVEEGKKREALRHASKMQKQGQKVAAMKKAKTKEGREGERGEDRELAKEKFDPKKEIEEIRETSLVHGEALTEQKRQLDIAQGKDPAISEAQQVREASITKEQALKGQLAGEQPRGNDMAAASFLLGDNAKNLDRSQDAAAAQAQQSNSPVQGVMDLAKALLPVNLPDMRDKNQGQQQGGPGM